MTQRQLCLFSYSCTYNYKILTFDKKNMLAQTTVTLNPICENLALIRNIILLLLQNIDM